MLVRGEGIELMMMLMRCTDIELNWETLYVVMLF